MSDSPLRPRLRELLTRSDKDLDLAEAALLVAQEEYPDLDVDAYLHRFEEMARELRQRLAAEPRPERFVMALNHYFFQELGFRGNTQAYYDPRNSYLNEVIDRRMGIPITLSTVYMEVAARAGLSVEGVGLPGHFVVRVLIPEHGVLIDPFHQGALLSDKDCQERLDRIFGGKVKVDSCMLESAGPREMLERILRNLKDIYVKERDHKRALRTVDLLLELAPAETDDLRDRGILYAALDCYGLAVRDLEAYLAQVPGASDAEELQARLVPLRQKAKRLN